MGFIDQYPDVSGSGVKEEKEEKEMCNLSNDENFIDDSTDIKNNNSYDYYGLTKVSRSLWSTEEATTVETTSIIAFLSPFYTRSEEV